MTNKEIAEEIVQGKRKSVRVADLKRATAIRVAGHRKGAILTVQRDKNAWRVVKSSASQRRKRTVAKRGARSPVAGRAG